MQENQAIPLVSVIIPCRNEVRHIRRCVQKIAENDHPNIEVIVVDGKSTDGTVDELQSIQKDFQCQVITNEQQITPVAFNLGIEASNGQYIIIVGARMELQPNYVSTCINEMVADPRLGCVGGVIQNEYENDTSEVIAAVTASPFGVGGGNFRTLRKDEFVDTVSAPCYRREIFEQLGMFDEDLVRNQDDEFNFRVTQAGMLILQTIKTGYRYYVRGNIGGLFKQYQQYGYWKVFVNRKHKTVTTFRQLVPFFFVCYLLLGIPIAIFEDDLFAIYAMPLLLYWIVATIVSARLVNDYALGQWKIFPAVWVLLNLHVGYGWGYLRGVIDFLILRKKPSEQQKTLSR